MKQSHKTILLWFVFVLILVLIYQIMVTPSSTAEKIKYSQFIEAVRNDQIEEVEARRRTELSQARSQDDSPTA